MMKLTGWMLLCALSASALAQEVSDADKRVVQTVKRLGSFNYAKANQKTKEAIDRYLNATVGDAEYFQFVEKYGVTGQAENLLKLAVERAGEPAAGQSLKLLFQLGQADAVKNKLRELPEEAAASLLESAASVGAKEAVAAVSAVLTDASAAPALRAAAVKGLGQNTSGQRELLALAKDGKLPDDLKEEAAKALATSTDEGIRDEAAALFADAAPVAPLPPVEELVKRAGNAEKGREVYMTYCFTCHQVNGEGIDFGPALGEIGGKLAREGLYDAILKPSAAISFGYEGWTVTTKNGDTFTGILASETADELILKLPGGVLQQCAKADVTERVKLDVSLMTPNLHTVMTTGQLVDLVEYLAGLKKKD